MRISDWSSDVCSSDLDGAQRTDEVVGAVVAHDADGLHRQKHGEGLPDRVVKAGLADFVEIDCIRLAQDVELFAGYGTGAADCETRTRERVAADEAFRQAEFAAEGADLVLEELA